MIMWDNLIWNGGQYNISTANSIFSYIFNTKF